MILFVIDKSVLSLLKNSSIILYGTDIWSCSECSAKSGHVGLHIWDLLCQPYNYIIVLKFENDMNISYSFCIFIFKIVHS